MKFGDVVKMRHRGPHWPLDTHGECELRAMVIDDRHIVIIIPAERGVFSKPVIIKQQDLQRDWELA